jgi:phosphoglycolate phosphatase
VTPALLLLDLDGTLVDSFADIRRGIVHAFAALGVAAEPAWLELCRRGVALEVFYRHAFGEPRTAAERERRGRFVAAYRDYYLEHQENTRPYDGVADTLAWLRGSRAGLRVAVATAKRSNMAEAVVARCGLAHLVDLVQGSEGLAKKPDPAVLARAAARLDRPLAGAVMVGDTDGDVLAARAAGCRAVAVTYGGWSRDELHPLAPDHLIDRFEELRELV